MPIAVTDSIITTKAQAPLDVRTVVESIQQIDSIQNPYKGLVFYAKAQDAFYKVIQIEQKKVGLSTVYTVKFYQKMPDSSIYNLIDNINNSVLVLTSEVNSIKEKAITFQILEEI